jgi:hypothetical protein
MSDASDESERLVEQLGTFLVGVCPPAICSHHLHRRHPAHRLVIEPIVRKASGMRIYGLDDEQGLRREVLSMGVAKPGHVEIDLSREVVSGHEIVWNASGWERGAIVLEANLNDDELAEIFRWCSGPSVCSSWSQIKKGTPAPAIKHAQAVASQGATAFSFSASNGIEWMDVFPPASDALRLFALAGRCCRPFKRYIEHNPGADEIIYDRAPYSEML